MAYSGQMTVSTPGMAVKISDELTGGHVMIRALPINTGLVYLGDENVSSGNGIVLAGGDVVVMMYAGELEGVWLDADKCGEGVAWLKLEI